MNKQKHKETKSRIEETKTSKKRQNIKKTKQKKTRQIQGHGQRKKSTI